VTFFTESQYHPSTEFQGDRFSVPQEVHPFLGRHYRKSVALRETKRGERIRSPSMSSSGKVFDAVIGLEF
jgi:hypothetical protein